ncbi:hypothetical protein JYT99_02585 [bacterium AH-315-E09]|nr:hypothetical protein [bacterium AH-315-E09]
MLKYLSEQEEKTIKLMFVVLELDDDSKKIVKESVEKVGLKLFFEEIDFLEVDEEVKEKIRTLKTVLGDLPDEGVSYE